MSVHRGNFFFNKKRLFYVFALKIEKYRKSKNQGKFNDFDYLNFEYLLLGEKIVIFKNYTY